MGVGVLVGVTAGVLVGVLVGVGGIGVVDGVGVGVTGSPLQQSTHLSYTVAVHSTIASQSGTTPSIK